MTSVSRISSSQWYSMTTSDFASYNAIILPDPFFGLPFLLQYLVDTKTVWSPAITGNMIILGVEPSWFSPAKQGAVDLINDGLRFAVNGSTTGLFFVIPTSLDQVQTSGQVEALSEFGDFTMRIRDMNLCYDTVHLSGTSASFPSLTNSGLDHWGCRVNEIFESYPSSFSPLASAQSYDRTFNLRARLLVPINAPVTPIDRPYILTRNALVINGNGPTSTFTSTSSTFTTEIPSSTTTLDASTSTSDSPSADSRPLEITTLPETVAPIVLTSTTVIQTTTAEIISSSETSSSTFVEPSTTSFGIATISAAETDSNTVPKETSTSTFFPQPTMHGFESLESIARASSTKSTISTSTLSSSTSMESAVASMNSFPEPVATFSFLGCVGSHDGHSAFNLEVSSPLMDLEMCALACQGRIYAGVFNK